MPRLVQVVGSILFVPRLQVYGHGRRSLSPLGDCHTDMRPTLRRRFLVDDNMIGMEKKKAHYNPNIIKKYGRSLLFFLIGPTKHNLN